MEPKNPDPEFARQSLGEFFAEQGVKKQVRLSTLQEVEKFVEGMMESADDNSYMGIAKLIDGGKSLENATRIHNSALQAILTHIQEMKGEL